jgi:hypothetical protein
MPRGRGPAVVIAALLVGVPAATATVAGWNPFDDGDRNPRFPPPAVSRQAVDPSLTSQLGVLRRPQTDADRGVATKRATQSYSSAGYRGAQVNGIRLLDPARGIVLVPFERGPVPTDSRGKPVPGFDPRTYTNVVCVFERTADGFAANGCHTAAKIRSGFAISSGSGEISGLVPDGVATVRLVRGDQSADAPVDDNLFVVADDGVAIPREIDWLADDGSLVKRIDLTSPPPGAAPGGPPPSP